MTDANTKLATESARAQNLQDEIDGYKKQVEDAQQERDEAVAKAESYNKLLDAANLYITDGGTSAANAVGDLDASAYEGSAKTLYESMAGAVSTTLFNQYYNSGTTAYMAKDYASAAAQLKKAVEADPERTNSQYADALLYMGIAYLQLGDQSSAKAAYEELLKYYPEKAATVQGYFSGTSDISSDSAADLSGLGDAATGQTASDGTTEPTGDTDGSVTIIDGGSQNLPQPDSYVAWTDPNTGEQYDQYGNKMS